MSAAIIISLVTTITFLILRELAIGGVKSIYSRVEAKLKAETDEQLERIKSVLAAQNATALEDQRAQLRMLTESFIARTSHLVEQRFGILVLLYRLTIALQPTLEKAVSPGKIYVGETNRAAMDAFQTKLEESFAEAYKAFYEFVPPNRIFWDRALDEQIEELLTVCSDAWKDYTGAAKQGKIDTGLWQEAHRKAQEVLPGIEEAIRDRIRDILGVESSVPLRA